MQYLIKKSKLGTSQFIRATLALRDQRECRFGLVDAAMSVVLMVGSVTFMHFLLRSL